MATSNTIGQTVFTTRQVIEAAARRAGVKAQQLTAEHVTIANDALFLYLSALANDGAPLWCIEQVLMPLYEGVGAVTLPVGTVDVLSANLRSLQEVTGGNTDSSTQRVVSLASDTFIGSVGIKWSAAAVPLEFARSDDNSTWTVIQTEVASGSASGDWDWYDLDSVVPASFFRVRATSGTLGFETIFLGNTPSEVPMARFNREQYGWIADKMRRSSTITDFWVDRQADQPVLRLNPIPDDAAELKQLVVWRHRHVMDVGTMTQSLEVPQRWYEAVVSGLATKLVWEFDEADRSRAPALALAASQSLYNAQNEERDGGPIQWLPSIGCYTA